MTEREKMLAGVGIIHYSNYLIDFRPVWLCALRDGGSRYVFRECRIIFLQIINHRLLY